MRRLLLSVLVLGLLGFAPARAQAIGTIQVDSYTSTTATFSGSYSGVTNQNTESAFGECYDSSGNMVGLDGTSVGTPFTLTVQVVTGASCRGTLWVYTWRGHTEVAATMVASTPYFTP